MIENETAQYTPVPEDRCPLCWWAGIDSLRADGCEYCEEHMAKEMEEDY